MLGLLLAVAFAYLSFGSAPLRADAVSYTFTGAGDLAGTEFTYISPSGFISSPTGMLTVNPPGVLTGPPGVFAPPPQILSSFSIIPDTAIPGLELLVLGNVQFGGSEFVPINPINLGSFGTVVVFDPIPRNGGVFGTFVIAPASGPVPESGSLAMLLAGLLVLGVLAGLRSRRRLECPAA